MVKKRRLLSGNSSGTKPKSREPMSPQSGEEVLSARDRFKGALQDLFPHSDEETETSDDESDQWHSRSKRLSAIKKKQIEKPVETNDTTYKPFVMKLFHRSVDLAQFTESTPLYPICRAWVINHPHEANKVKAEPNSSPKSEEPMQIGDESNSSGSKDIYKLPPPEKIEGNDTVRIPSRIPYITQFDKMDQYGQAAPTKEQLLQDNLSHWTKVKRSWMDASAKNEARYSKSFQVLMGMINK